MSEFEVGDFVEIKSGWSDWVYDAWEELAVVFKIFNWRRLESPLYSKVYKVMGSKTAGSGVLVHVESVDGKRCGFIMDEKALEYVGVREYLELEDFLV